MKKIVNITVILFLMIATTGVSISKHYCHGFLISSSLFGTAKSCCDGSCGACHNEISFTKVTDNFVQSHSELPQVKNLILFCVQPIALFEINVLHTDIDSFIYSHLKAPPPNLYSETPEFLENFRC